jgi:hypothetical protein
MPATAPGELLAERFRVLRLGKAEHPARRSSRRRKDVNGAADKVAAAPRTRSLFLRPSIFSAGRAAWCRYSHRRPDRVSLPYGASWLAFRLAAICRRVARPRRRTDAAGGFLLKTSRAASGNRHRRAAGRPHSRGDLLGAARIKLVPGREFERVAASARVSIRPAQM